MRISDEALDEFIAIYNDDFGEELDRKEAIEMAQRVLTLYQLLAKKVTEEHIHVESPMPLTDDHPPIGFRI